MCVRSSLAPRGASLATPSVTTIRGSRNNFRSLFVCISSMAISLEDCNLVQILVTVFGEDASMKAAFVNRKDDNHWSYRKVQTHLSSPLDLSGVFALEQHTTANTVRVAVLDSDKVKKMYLSVSEKDGVPEKYPKFRDMEEASSFHTDFIQEYKGGFFSLSCKVSTGTVQLYVAPHMKRIGATPNAMPQHIFMTGPVDKSLLDGACQ